MNITGTPRCNEFGQPIGPELDGWRHPLILGPVTLTGCYCRVEPLDVARHARELHEANSLDREGRMWTYLFSGPYATFADYEAWLQPREGSRDPLFRSIVDVASGAAVGLGSFMRIDPAHGCIEVGHLAFSPRLQRTPAATEAMYLMMRQAFELGYRRYEWKCDAFNEPSRAAALRLGFVFEGIFRQAIVYKGRNRDTAWFSIIDSEWPLCRDAFEQWLAPANFDAAGQQRERLAKIRDRLRGTV